MASNLIGYIKARDPAREKLAADVASFTGDVTVLAPQECKTHGTKSAKQMNAESYIQSEARKAEAAQVKDMADVLLRHRRRNGKA